jgi:hypothetical protein
MNDDSNERETAVREAQQLIGGAVTAVPIVLLAFWLHHGVINGFAWGVAGFLAGICLLAAVGVYFRPRQEYHSPVELRGDWGDKIGAFWLVSCAFGALVSWIFAQSQTISADSWETRYWLWIFLAIGLPLATAVPLFPYLRGPSILVGLPLLLIITFIPIWLASGAAYDLWYGPVERLIPETEQWELYLQYTGRAVGLVE